MEPIISLEQVSKHYQNFTLGPLDLSLPAGYIMGLIGENGAGKSTAIRLMLDLARPDSGSIRLLGKENRSLGPLDREEIGVVLDETCFPEHLTVRQLEAVLASAYRLWQPEAFQGYLDRFQLPREKRIREFSRGMKRKLVIAAALSHQARLLILDEATSGLDPVVRDEILDLLYDFTRDERCSILISSHILSDLEKLCDYIACLHRGKLIFCEEKDALLERFGLVRCSAAQLEALPADAVAAVRQTSYAAEALVELSKLPPCLQAERCDIETIMVMLLRGGKRI